MELLKGLFPSANSGCTDSVVYLSSNQENGYSGGRCSRRAQYAIFDVTVTIGVKATA